jgi:hypothetical protein
MAPNKNVKLKKETGKRGGLQLRSQRRQNKTTHKDKANKNSIREEQADDG